MYLVAFLVAAAPQGCKWCVSSETALVEESRTKASRNKNIETFQVGKLTAIWAATGESKVRRDELRASNSPAAVINTIWDGSRVVLFGARNEVIAFNLVLEAAHGPAQEVSVKFQQLHGPKDAVIGSKDARRAELFQWIERPIELFYIRYLQIRGLSVFNYAASYDERHIPKSLRRPMKGNGRAEWGSDWKDRPGADKYYPDIAVPLELHPSFEVPAQSNQSIWVDVYISKNTPAGRYHGFLTVMQEKTLKNIPVSLDVLDFELADRSSCKTMVHLVVEDINHRYLGTRWPNDRTPLAEQSNRLIDKHFLLARRHRVTLIDSNYGSEVWEKDEPRPAWKARLDGSLFTPVHGYEGPGMGLGNDVFSIGTYGSWGWKSGGENAMHAHSDAWIKWFETNAPGTETFLYLLDEPTSKDYPQVEQWCRYLASNSGPGKRLRSMSTVSIPVALKHIPSLEIACSGAMFGITRKWNEALGLVREKGRPVWVYNTMRPACGTVAIEDDGVAMRQMAWTQYKLGIDRWFLWASTFYNNNHCAQVVETNVFQRAQTNGCDSRADPVLGRTGWNYANGEGVLFYPGTDQSHPGDSYSIDGPFASLRLKHWRRGIQDVEYLVEAAKKNPEGVRKLLDRMVPKVLWEIGVDNEDDPTYVHTDISWPTEPDVWESARRNLADWITEKP